eukprot:GFUD01019159.1.p1 GENE.GFUD01019159.1~~GFUD01019159.1.p1  ORF type:complete len:526 (+),score=104.96 GFUD01019159.1:85-1662(+)
MKVLNHSFSFTGRLQHSKYCDINITTPEGAVAGQVVPAHRVILAAVSDKLEEIIDRVGVRLGTVKLRDIKFEVLKKIVGFIYSGRVELHDSEDFEKFKNGLDMLNINIQVDQFECLENSSEIPFNEYDNVPISLLENDLNLSSNSLESVENSEIVANSLKVLTGVTSELIVTNSSEDTLDIGEELIDTDYDSIDKDKNFVDSSVNCEKVLYQSLAEAELSSSESESENIITPSGYRNNNLPEENLVYNALNPANSRVKCSFCGSILAYKAYGKHCRKFHPHVANLTNKYCETCQRRVPSFCNELHLLIYHRKMSEVQVPASLKPKVQINLPEENFEYNALEPRYSRVKCSVCGFFVTHEKLPRHCKSLHPNDTELLAKKCCEICNQMMPACSFKFHQLIYHYHEKVKVPASRISCPYCPRKLRKDCLQRHIKALHRQEQDKLAQENPLKHIKDKDGIPLARIKFVMQNTMFQVGQKDPRKPILKSMRFVSKKVGVDMKFLLFKYKNRVLSGLEASIEFDREKNVV